ncbi:valine--tRNA ligase [Cytospora paraplurivora]|uniref:valine--tRNA ligase n=1 Tax=Cytospora paraplurivora TaxID=2898453 RepID=A0AAN9UA50_9PEZI
MLTFGAIVAAAEGLQQQDGMLRPVSVSGNNETAAAAKSKKTERDLEKERRKAEKQAKFEHKRAAQAAAAANATKTTKEKKEREKKNAEAEVLPPFVEDTPAGEKKRFRPLDDPYYSSYHPVAVESAWYAWWEKEGFFKPQFTPEGKVKPEGKFVIVMPPPNVTGVLQYATPFVCFYTFETKQH